MKHPVAGVPKASDAELLAMLCHLLGSKLRSASRQLHDDIGPLLSVAGLQLQMLRTDVPLAGAGIDGVLQILEQAIQRIRTVSGELHSSPAEQVGLKNALLRAAEQNSWLSVSYSATAPLPSEDAGALYQAAIQAASEALRARASKVRISVSGKAGVRIQVADNGRPKGRVRALSVHRLLAEQAGLTFECATGKSTIVSIRYAHRRPARG